MANVWTNGRLRRILVGYDGSSESERALEQALALADCTDGKVLVLSVARPPEPETSNAANFQNAAREQLERKLSQIQARVQENRIEIQTQVATGHPAEEILTKAREDQVDLIVLGYRGVSGVDQVTLGSISGHVVTHASCPVMVAR